MPNRFGAGCGCCGQQSGGVAISGCPCAESPATLTMSVSNTKADGGVFQPCSIQFQPTPPGYAGLGMDAYSYLSTQSFQDQSTGDTFRYYLSCIPGAYALSRVYVTSVYGSPYRGPVLYRWYINGKANSCSPFMLAGGSSYSAGDPSNLVVITE